MITSPPAYKILQNTKSYFRTKKIKNIKNGKFVTKGACATAGGASLEAKFAPSHQHLSVQNRSCFVDVSLPAGLKGLPVTVCTLEHKSLRDVQPPSSPGSANDSNVMSWRFAKCESRWNARNLLPLSGGNGNQDDTANNFICCPPYLAGAVVAGSTLTRDVRNRCTSVSRRNIWRFS